MRQGRGSLAVGCLASLVLLAAPTTAWAQGWLAGGSAGIGKQYDYEVGGPIDSRDEEDFAYRVFGGYLFVRNVGVAVSYVDLGEPNYDGPAFGGFTDVLGADGWDFSLIGGFAPGKQERFTLFGTVGLFRWKQDVRYEDASGVYTYKDSGSSPSYSLGGEVNFGEGARWGLHFDYQRFDAVGDRNNSGHEYDRSLASVGAHYRFGR